MSSAASSTLAPLLPGQPLPIPVRAPKPQPGHGTYARGSHILSSLVGMPGTDGANVTVTGADTRFVVPEPDSIVSTIGLHG